jgi:hypothetical protein
VTAGQSGLVRGLLATLSAVAALLLLPGPARASGGIQGCDYEAVITAVSGKPPTPRDNLFDYRVQVRIATARPTGSTGLPDLPNAPAPTPCSYKPGELVDYPLPLERPHWVRFLPVGARIKFGHRRSYNQNGGSQSEHVELPGQLSWADRQGVERQGGLDAGALKARLAELGQTGLAASFVPAGNDDALVLECPDKGPCAWKERRIIKHPMGELALLPGKVVGKAGLAAQVEWLCPAQVPLELPGWKERTPSRRCLFGPELKGLRYQGGRFTGTLKGTVQVQGLVNTDPYCRPLRSAPLPAGCAADKVTASLPIMVKVSVPLRVKRGP